MKKYTNQIDRRQAKLELLSGENLDDASPEAINRAHKIARFAGKCAVASGALLVAVGMINGDSTAGELFTLGAGALLLGEGLDIQRAGSELASQTLQPEPEVAAAQPAADLAVRKAA